MKGFIQIEGPNGDRLSINPALIVAVQRQNNAWTIHTTGGPIGVPAGLGTEVEKEWRRHAETAGAGR
jgi:hypothetical protein